MPPLPTGLVRNKSGRYYLRRRIPQDLLPIYNEGKKKITVKEINKSLATSDYRMAIERHRQEEARLTHEWSEMREEIARDNASRMVRAVTVINELTEDEINRLCNLFENQSLDGDERRRQEGSYSIEDIQEYQEGYSAALTDLRSAVAIGDIATLRPMLDQFLYLTQHRLNVSEQDYRRLALAFGRMAIRTNESLLKRYQGETVATPLLLGPNTSPLISEIVNKFLKEKSTEKAKPMLSKHKMCLALFVKFLEDRPVNQIRQIDIRNFLLMVQKLPPHWNYRKEGPIELAKHEHPKTISLKTYEGTYRASLSKFIGYASGNHADDGVSPNLALTVGKVAYEGTRTEPEENQRAFKPQELVRLFQGEEMKKWAKSRDMEAAAHYWLPHIGLFTGARINEICQINPQVDVVQNENGHWFLAITKLTEADDGIVKRLKNKASHRHIPIHSKLIELGLLGYLQEIKQCGAKRLFPAFNPVSDKASSEAEEWFTQLLRQTGLRDETLGAQLVGMHAFRSTVLNRANNLGIVGMGEITGHARKKTANNSGATNRTDSEDVSAVMRGYQGELDLEVKCEILEKLHFAVQYIPSVWTDDDIPTA